MVTLERDGVGTTPESRSNLFNQSRLHRSARGLFVLRRLDDCRRFGRRRQMRARRQFVVGHALIDLTIALLQRDKIVVGERLGRIGDAFILHPPLGEIAALHSAGLRVGFPGCAEGEKEAETGKEEAGHGGLSIAASPEFRR